jgi:hypothetical protein
MDGIDQRLILGLATAAAVLALVFAHRSRVENMRLLFGGLAVAAGIVVLALVAERF